MSIITLHQDIPSTSEQFDFDFATGSARLTATKFKQHCKYFNQTLTVSFGTPKRGRTQYCASVFVIPEHADIPEANRVIGFYVLEDLRTRADQDSAVRFSSNVGAKTITSARAIYARSRREALRFVSNNAVDTARKLHIPLIKNAAKMLTANVAKFVERSLMKQGVTNADVYMDAKLGNKFEASDIYRSARSTAPRQIACNPNRKSKSKKVLQNEPSDKAESQNEVEKMNETMMACKIDEVD